MKNRFRSRGIRIQKNINCGFVEQMKIYYEMESAKTFHNKIIDELISKNILEYFEYSVLENEKIDTYNFHVNLIGEYEEIYLGLSEEEKERLNYIRNIFDKTFKNYTVGYKLDNQVITKHSYYFYPTVFKETRYRIQGIVDKSVINCEVKRFSEYIACSNKETQEEIIQFGRALNKLKGVSIHVSGDKIGYKLYGRMEKNILAEFLKEYMRYDVDKNKQYGEIVLISQRIQDRTIKGYNIYYLS